MVVSDISYFHPHLGKNSNLTSIFFTWVETTNQFTIPQIWPFHPQRIGLPCVFFSPPTKKDSTPRFPYEDFATALCGAWRWIWWHSGVGWIGKLFLNKQTTGWLRSKESRWWFQICFLCSPLLGQDSHFWLIFFSNGLKPPTRSNTVIRIYRNPSDSTITVQFI